MKKNKKVTLPKKPPLVLSRRAVIGWGCFLIFVCAWMFFIGVLVGRGTAPIEFDIAAIQKKLGASTEDLKKKEQLRTQGKPGIAKDKTKLDFYEALTENRQDTPISKKKPSASIGKKIKSAPEKKPLENKKGKTGQRASKKADTPKPASAKPSRTTPIASKSKTRPAIKTYTIQAASVKDARDADRLVAALKKKGFQAYRAIGKVPGKGIWYRVRIGEYTSRTSARHTLNRLKKIGLKPLVVEK